MGTTTLSACLLGDPMFSGDGHDLEVPDSCKPLLSPLIAPEGAEPSARRQLNTAVWRLRRLLDDGRTPGAAIIVSGAGGPTILPQCEVWVDALDFGLSAAPSRVPAERWDHDDKGGGPP